MQDTAPSPFDVRLRALHDARDAASVAAFLESTTLSEFMSNPQHAFYRADALRRLGRRDEAIDFLCELAPAFDRRGNDELHRQRLNLLGMLYFDTGRIQKAEAAWRTLCDDASEAEDHAHVARASHNLGAIYTLQVRTEEALAAYERAMGAYRSMGHRRGLAQCHHNLGLTYRELQFGPKADNHFLQAIRYATADHCEDELARAEQERALLIFLDRNDAALARITAKRALQRFNDIEELAGAGEAMRVLGLIALGEHDDKVARQHFRDAMVRAVATGNALLEAECLEAIAALEERAGNRDTAGTTRDRAREMFHKLGAVEWGTRERLRVHAIAARV